MTTISADGERRQRAAEAADPRARRLGTPGVTSTQRELHSARLRPNVLLVIFDAARRDAFEPYGAPPGSTPTVAQLARRGTSLPEVYATGCWTAPSHASMFTGLLPRTAGVSHVPSPASAKAAMEAHRERVLPEVFRQAGYATVAVTANLWCSPASGFDGGFEHFEEVDPGRHARIEGDGLRARLHWDWEAVSGRVDHGARAAGPALDKALAGIRQRPFFAFVNLMEAHSPYLPPLPYGGFAPLRRLRMAEDARRHYTFAGICRACAGVDQVPAETLERASHFYRAGIRYMDDWLADRLQSLDKQGALEDTVVIVVADHGENLGENGLLAHALSLDNRLLHVPFVVAGPEAASTPIHSLADLPLYIADRVGLVDHPWRDRPRYECGIAQFDPPGVSDDPDAIEAFERIGLGEVLQPFTTPLTCAVSGHLKLVLRGEREEVYDLRADPLETSPLSPDQLGAAESSVIERLRVTIESAGGEPRVAATASPAADTAASDEELQDLEARMRLLGYL